MSEFKKWNKQFSTAKQEKDDPIKSLLTRARKEAYRAGLEMVKTKIFEHKNALDVIEEELDHI